MSAAAEHVRLALLAQKQQADRKVARAERLGAHLERLWEAGDEPSAALIAEYESAIRAAEVALLERAVSMPATEEP